MERINIEALRFILKENRDQRVLFTFHSFGDTDSVSSALALASYLKNSTVATPDLITSNCARILRRLGVDPDTTIGRKFDDTAKLVVLLDVNNFEDCGSFRFRLEEFRGQILVIDHHAPKGIEKDDVQVFNDETFNSASSIVYEVLKGIGGTIDQKTAKLLLSGIISDSADLKNTTAETFVQMGELLKIAETDYVSFLEELQHIAEAQARERTFEDLKHATAEVMEGLFFVYGRAHAHANLAADAAVKYGADVAIFYTENKEFSVSARMRPPLDKRYGIHLGVLMKALAPTVHGTGGGHPCAAGAYGPEEAADPSEFIRKLMSEIIRRVKK
jgi:nanoRNase/pAp phosphatase (c-di-AMP/oligoRNAs hydrolase)